MKEPVTVSEVETPIDLSKETIAAINHTVGVDRRRSTVAQEEERALATSGQRNINHMWESTQRFIAVGVTYTALLVSAWLAVMGERESMTAAFVFLYGVANLVIGFYFGRTNHQRSGGIDAVREPR